MRPQARERATVDAADEELRKEMHVRAYLSYFVNRSDSTCLKHLTYSV